ncbi:glycosyl transferase group 1 [Chloroherpeton thalassium ATCC 35110]|uniref:Glycosyl transferase group 1 n=2 Tax=Chloroherpeton thalassium TaxID=100716 RepID=B3QV53_CHLT3|nr:glycosyl transferase group 1 [Chloroherpeton thalassium ATCC 35110]
MDILPFKKFLWLKKLSKTITGDLDQQLRALSLLSRYDAIYAMINGPIVGLCFLRKAGLLKTPIIVLAHGLPPYDHPSFKISYQGADHVIATNRVTYERIKSRYNLPDEKITLMNWWSDIEFYPDYSREERTEPFLFSNGQSWRDYSTLFQAVTKAGIKAKFIIPESQLSSDYGKNIEVTVYRKNPHANFQDGFMPGDFLPILRKTTIVAIPLDENRLHRSNGITNMMEAFAAGVPVIMTESPCIDIDIEREGSGFWVKEGDVEDWVEKITRISNNPTLQKQMAANARKTAEKYKVQSFSEGLCQTIKKVTN